MHAIAPRLSHPTIAAVRLSELGIDKDLATVIVLGAGASRGSSCARSTGIAPPLDADFFAQAQRMPASSLTPRDRDLLTFIREEFVHGDLPTLEVFFTQVSAVDRFHRQFNIRGRPSGRYGRHLEALRRLIPRVFDQALGGLDCLWHQRLAAALRAGDAVMSFNYDTLIDRALREAGGKRWNPQVGYGFTASGGMDLWNPPPSPGPTRKNPIKLLKPHGSLNWQIDEENRAVHLVDEYDPATEGSIVPPTWDKSDVTNWPWNEVWRSARSALGLARLLVVIGYSVPVTDQMSQALLRADVNNLAAVVVVNPDRPSRRRIIELMSSALAPSASVIELDTLEDFASYLPPSPSEPDALDIDREVRRLRVQVRRLQRKASSLAEGQETAEVEASDARETIERLAERLEELEDLDLADMVERLQGEVRDFDARLDSMLP